MTNKKEIHYSTGGSATGIPTILLVVFIVLKLTGVITWSWWWVLSPLWISFSLVVVAVLVFILAALLGRYVLNRKDRN